MTPLRSCVARPSIGTDDTVAQGSLHCKGCELQMPIDGDAPGHRFPAPGGSVGTRTETEERQFEFRPISPESGDTRGHSFKTVRDRVDQSTESKFTFANLNSARIGGPHRFQPCAIDPDGSAKGAWCGTSSRDPGARGRSSQALPAWASRRP